MWLVFPPPDLATLGEIQLFVFMMMMKRETHIGFLRAESSVGYKWGNERLLVNVNWPINIRTRDTISLIIFPDLTVRRKKIVFLIIRMFTPACLWVTDRHLSLLLYREIIPVSVCICVFVCLNPPQSKWFYSICSSPPLFPNTGRQD